MNQNEAYIYHYKEKLKFHSLVRHASFGIRPVGLLSHVRRRFQSLHKIRLYLIFHRTKETNIKLNGINIIINTSARIHFLPLFIDEKKELQDRIDNAIEFINDIQNSDYVDLRITIKELLEILKGSDKE